MATVHFESYGKKVSVAVGTTILDAARRVGVTLEAPCNGTGKCGKCLVRLGHSSQSAVRSRNPHPIPSDPGTVLACDTEVLADVTIKASVGHRQFGLQIISDGQRVNVPLQPHITKRFDAAAGNTNVFAGEHLLTVETGDTRQENYGVVVDIGTTTLVAALLDLNTGCELGTASALNPQSHHGQDVLSRITLASRPEGLNLLYHAIIDAINALIDELLDKVSISREYIYEIVFSGNTCMLHLATRTNPSSLGKYPYPVTLECATHQSAASHKLRIASAGLVYLPPIVSAFVGADITAGMLAADLAARKGVTLFIDIGTNGEMVLATDGKLTATSTAAGPAFEGMNITHGMRANTGAIERFEIGEDDEVSCKTIGDAEAAGICGSGLLDLVGELVDKGVVNAQGRFAPAARLRPKLAKLFSTVNGKPAFQVTERVVLTQKDVRQVQLAKAAIRAGIEFLLSQTGYCASQVDHVLIAGSFGFHLTPRSLLQLGLLPPEAEGKIEFLGNTSKTGGTAFLLNAECRLRISNLVRQVRSLELANIPEFERVFVRCINFEWHGGQTIARESMQLAVRA